MPELNLGFLDEIKLDEKGLIPCIAQDYETNEILMVAYMNKDSLRQTLERGLASYWSRSRQKFWIKGETSGNTQEVKEMYFDCDMDCILIKIKQNGGSACHTGHRTCFYRRVQDGQLIEEGELVFDPKKVYDKKG